MQIIILWFYLPGKKITELTGVSLKIENFVGDRISLMVASWELSSSIKELFHLTG